jgi:hypothetical protein
MRPWLTIVAVTPSSWAPWRKKCAKQRTNAGFTFRAQDAAASAFETYTSANERAVGSPCVCSKFPTASPVRVRSELSGLKPGHVSSDSGGAGTFFQPATKSVRLRTTERAFAWSAAVMRFFGSVSAAARATAGTPMQRATRTTRRRGIGGA